MRSSCSCAASADARASIRPRRLATRCTWVSTGMAGMFRLNSKTHGALPPAPLEDHRIQLAEVALAQPDADGHAAADERLALRRGRVAREKLQRIVAVAFLLLADLPVGLLDPVRHRRRCERLLDQI